MRCVRIAVALALGLGVAAAGLSPQRAAAQAQPVKVKIAVLQAAFVYFTTYVAEAQGFYKKHGLDAELVYFRSGNETTTAIVSGSTEFGAVATEHILQVREKGIVLKAIVANLLDSPYTLIVRNEVPLPHAAAGYPEVIRDLKGLRLGVTGFGASTDFTLRFVTAQAGLNPDKDVTIIATGGVTTTLAALEKGDIQGFMAFEPIQSQAIYGLKVAKPVLDVRKGEGPALFRPYAYNSMAAREDYLNANPDVARRMVQAIVDTERFIQDPANFEQVVAVAGTYFKGFDPKLLRQILKDSIGAYKPVITREAMDNINSLLVFAKLIKKPVPFEDVVDTRFAPTAF
jgi:NitT/TauT family transport system substrate-binding protein